MAGICVKGSDGDGVARVCRECRKSPPRKRHSIKHSEVGADRRRKNVKNTNKKKFEIKNSSNFRQLQIKIKKWEREL